jgi:hypothetical protein
MKLPEVPQRTTPGFSFSIVERALMECIAVRQFGKPEIQEVLAFFGANPPSCAFCGAFPIQRWDHLVAVSKGGDTVVGNIVPACAKCDDSKGALPFEEWALGSTPGSPTSRGIADVRERVERIRSYVAKYAYSPRPPEERLAPDELAQFGVLRDDLRRLRHDFDQFIVLYRARTGLR